MNLGNFDKQAREAERKVQLQAKLAITALSQELFAELSKRAWDDAPGGSPVASGRYAGSMRISLNRIDTTTEPEDRGYNYPSPDVHKYDADNLPGRTIRNVKASRVALALRAFKWGDTIYISNSVPYARRIERNGHSWQTRGGVFEITVRHVVKKFHYAKIRVLNV